MGKLGQQINSNQPTSVAQRSGATRGMVALRLERDSVLFYSRQIFKYEQEIFSVSPSSGIYTESIRGTNLDRTKSLILLLKNML